MRVTGPWFAHRIVDDPDSGHVFVPVCTVLCVDRQIRIVLKREMHPGVSVHNIEKPLLCHRCLEGNQSEFLQSFQSSVFPSVGMHQEYTHVKPRPPIT